MKTPIATIALSAALALAAPAPSQAQAPLGGGNVPSRPFQRTPGIEAPKTDAGLRQAQNTPPEPIPLDQLQGTDVALPNIPIDPYIIRKENGPFMVMARTFRGPDATRYALALTLELRSTYRVPAYIFHLKVKPGGSNIRNVQPTSPAPVPNADITAPEKYRVFDEAAVMVGDCKTLDDAEALLHKIRKYKLNCLDSLPTIWGQRKGTLKYGSFVTQNPLVAAQQLYPGGKIDGGHGHGHGQGPDAAGAPVQSGQTFDPFVATTALENAPKHDPLVERMNRGPHSIYKSAGPYTLEVAEFTGRSSVNVDDPRFQSGSFFRKSPLATAADDAELLAANLARCKRLGKEYEPYVYHDRYGSKVTIGSFSGPDDPKLARLRESMTGISEELLYRKYTQLPLAPSSGLMRVPQH